MCTGGQERVKFLHDRQVGAACLFLSTDWSSTFHRMHLGGVVQKCHPPMIFEACPSSLVDKIRLHVVSHERSSLQ